jgi:uncharacterized protein (TIGR00251 family)
VTRAEGGLLAVRVTPRARRTEIAGWQGSVLHVRVAAAPEAGEANRAVIEALAAAFAVPRSAVALLRGGRAREKLFRISGRSLDDLRGRVDGARA